VAADTGLAMPLSPTLPQGKSGLPDLPKIKMRNRGRPRLRGGGSRLSVPREIASHGGGAHRARVSASQMPPPIMKPPEMRDSSRVRCAEKKTRARPAASA
jgi:hypothetical protein